MKFHFAIFSSCSCWSASFAFAFAFAPPLLGSKSLLLPVLGNHHHRLRSKTSNRITRAYHKETKLRVREPLSAFSINTSKQQSDAFNVNPQQEENKKKNKKCIYLDYNGTTPIDKRVVDAMMPYFTDHFGNPSSAHFYGIIPKESISKARASLLSLLHTDIDIPSNTFTDTSTSTSTLTDDEEEKLRVQQQQSNSIHEQNSIIFTGCGTEADNLAIHLAIQSNLHIKTPHIITSNVEHPAISQYLQALTDDGKISVTYVAVNEQGIVPAQAMIDAINSRPHPSDTVLVTLMLANNESGALQPVKEVSAYCKERSILFHTDAAQAVGKVSVSLDEHGIGDGVDMMTIVGHKFGAPKGVACLYVKPNCLTRGNRVEPRNYMLLGGGQEGGKRAGTENVPYIVALGAAVDIILERDRYGSDLDLDLDLDLQWKKNAQWMETMRHRLKKNLIDGLGEGIVRDNGPFFHRERLPNTLSVGFKAVEAGELLNQIQMQVACSAGSACHASGGELSSVLEAMAVPTEYARGTLRLSTGPDTTEQEIDDASAIIVKAVKTQLGMI